MQEEERRKYGLSGILWLKAKMKFVRGRGEQVLCRPALVHGAALQGWPKAQRDWAVHFNTLPQGSSC